MKSKAFEANPGKGMMVEYPHLPEGIVTTVLPDHYRVKVSQEEKERMMQTTRMYSKVGRSGCHARVAHLRSRFSWGATSRLSCWGAAAHTSLGFRSRDQTSIEAEIEALD